MNSANEKVKFLLNWNHFSDHISNCMAKLMTDSSYSDVIIATGDKRMIYAHRFVLANSSKYFQRLLKQMNKQRGIQLVVALPEVKYEIFKILMNYMYRGESQVPHELLPSVIKTGRILEINGLIDLHEADSSAKGASIWKFKKGESQAPRTVIHTLKGKVHEGKKRDLHLHHHHHLHPPCPLPKSRSRELNVAMETKKKTKCQNLDIDSTSEGSGNQKNGIVRRFRPILPKNEKSTRSGKKHSSLQLPLKRKSTGKLMEKEIPSSSTENSAISPKKIPMQEDTPVIDIKREKLDDNSWEGENQPEEEITIKTEIPFEEEDVNYNELLCDYCNESYTNPSDWVRHMTENHGDRGYQTYKDIDKESRNDNVYTCVICSAVLLSAAEWARHLRIWHTDTELAKANKLANRAKKDSESKENSDKD